MTVYPFFIIKLIDKYFNKNWHPIKIFIIQFTINSISLFINLLAGFGVILPFFMAVYMGFNIGIIMYHTLQGRFFYLSLFNPVAILEIPATWLSFCMSIQFSLNNYFSIKSIPSISFNQYCIYFIMTIIPLLILSGIIETILIVIARRYENKESHE